MLNAGRPATGTQQIFPFQVSRSGKTASDLCLEPYERRRYYSCLISNIIIDSSRRYREDYFGSDIRELCMGMMRLRPSIYYRRNPLTAIRPDGFSHKIWTNSRRGGHLANMNPRELQRHMERVGVRSQRRKGRRFDGLSPRPFAVEIEIPE